MRKIAIGMFRTPELATDAERRLEANGFKRNEIRVIAEPRTFADPMTLGSLDEAGSSAVGMSTTRNEFEIDLVRELMADGASREDADVFRNGLRAGQTIVLVRGAESAVDSAALLMNQSGAGTVEELAGAPAGRRRSQGQTYQPHTYQELGEAAHHEGVVQAGRLRHRREGVQVFVW